MISTLTSHHRVELSSGGLEEPNIIILTEDHGQSEDAVKNASLIDRICETGSVVLVESTEPGKLDQHKEPQTRFVKKIIDVYGWDSPDGVKQIYDLGHKMHRLISEYETIIKEDVTTALTQEKIKSMLRQIGSTSRIGGAIAEGIVTQLNSRWLKNQLLVDIRYYGQTQWNYFAQKDRTRNISLVSAIDKHLKIAKKVIIIMGKAHAIGSDENLDVFRDYLRDKKFVILSPNETPISISSETPLISSDKKNNCCILSQKCLTIALIIIGLILITVGFSIGIPGLNSNPKDSVFIGMTTAGVFGSVLFLIGLYRLYRPYARSQSVTYNPHPTHWMRRLDMLASSSA